MPFESEAQKRFMWAVNPTLAKEFAKKTSKKKPSPKKKVLATPKKRKKLLGRKRAKK